MKISSTLTFTFCLLLSFSVSIGQSIYQVGYYSVNGISSMAAMPGYLVLGNGSFIDISNPYHPTLAGQVSLNGFATSIVIDGDMAWFGTGMMVNLIAVNISDPVNPRVISVHTFPGLSSGVFGMAKSGNYLYLTLGGDGLFAVNVTDPANPVVVDSLLMPGGQVRDVVVRDNLAYLAHGEGLKVVWVGDPQDLRLISGTGFGYNSIALDDEFLYTGKTSGGIDVYRLTNPQEPQLVGSKANGDGWAWDLKCHKGMVLESTDRGSLYAYAMENGRAVEKAYFANFEKGQSFSVTAQDSLIFLSGLIEGISVLVYDPNGSTGMESPENRPELTVYPNPAGDFLVPLLPGDTSYDIGIYSLTGEHLMQIPQVRNQTKIDISRLPAGQYLLRATGAQKSLTRKFMVR